MPTAGVNESDKPNTKPDRSAVRWLEVLLLLAVFFVVGGAPAPHVNESYYLAKAKHYWQPEWCAWDPFLESADAHLTFYWSVGWLAKWFSLPTVAWIGRLAAWLMLAVGWQRLSSRVVAQPYFSVLTAMLFAALIEKTNFAGEWVIGGVEGKCFAYGLVFWGLAAVAEGRWRAAWPWLGLAGAFHVLVGGWSTILAGIVWLVEPREKRMPLVPMLPSLVLGGVLALPGVLPALQLTQGVSAETTAEANSIYVFDRLPHHLAPLTLRTSELTRKAIRFGAVVLGFLAVWMFARTKHPESLNRILKFALGSLGLSLIGFSWELINWDRPAMAASLLKYYWFRMADIAVPLAVAIGLGWILALLLERRSKLAPLLLVFMIGLPGYWMFDLSLTRYKNPTPPADRKMKDPAAWQEACQWARENTPADAMFLVSRGSQSFEWYAHRKGLVTWKDVPQDAVSLISWRDRYFDVFAKVDEEGNRRSFTSLADQGAERISQLAEKYQTDYVITRDYPPLLLPVVYSNSRYKIYATPPTSKAQE